MKVISVPRGDFSSEFEAFLVGGIAYEIESEVAYNSHVFSTKAFTNAGEIVFKRDIKHPMLGVFDLPVKTNSFQKIFGR